MPKSSLAELTTAREAKISERLLKHWHQSVPNDRMAHLVKGVARSFLRSLQPRLNSEGVSLGHWSFLRTLWEREPPRELRRLQHLRSRPAKAEAHYPRQLASHSAVAV